MDKPKFLISKNKLLDQYDIVNKLADKVSYSSKTNQIITEILESETDSMFSVHLENELVHVKDRSRVIFLAQGWTSEQIVKLVRAGIEWFVVDNEPDLDKLLLYLDYYKGNINLLLRIKLREHSIRTERYFVFGMNSKIINKKLKEIHDKYSRKINSLGVHFHRKTQNISEWDLQYEFENIIDKDNLGIINYVNIGGGIPSEYANTNSEVVQGILKRIDSFRNWLSKNNIKMIIEPGRFLAAPAGKLVTKIINIYENNIVINASVYNSDMDALIVPVKLRVANEKKDGKAYVIKGVTPCSLDLFRYRVYLDNPKIGDEIIFENAGAYNFTTDFCDLDKIESDIEN